MIRAGTATTGTAGTDAASELVLLGRVTLSLLVVLVLAVLAGRLARRTRLGAGGSAARVHSRVGLTREASVAVVEVAGQALVLGVTPSSVTLLTTLEPTALQPSALQTDPLLVEPPAAGGRTGPRDGAQWSPRAFLESLRDRTVRRSP